MGKKTRKARKHARKGAAVTQNTQSVDTQSTDSASTSNAETASVAQTNQVADEATTGAVKTKKAGASSLGNTLSGILASRRKLIMIVAGLVLAIGGMATLHAVDKQRRELHDLTVIGNGQPAIVQIHDPGCSVCRRLKSVTTSAMEDLPDVNFRLADITTKEGRKFGDKYNLPKTTLLMFDAKGEHKHTLRGLVTQQEIADAASRFFDAPS